MMRSFMDRYIWLRTPDLHEAGLSELQVNIILTAARMSEPSMLHRAAHFRMWFSDIRYIDGLYRD